MPETVTIYVQLLEEGTPTNCISRRHCEERSDAAIQSLTRRPSRETLDCRASLAMTPRSVNSP